MLGTWRVQATPVASKSIAKTYVNMLRQLKFVQVRVGSALWERRFRVSGSGFRVQGLGFRDALAALANMPRARKALGAVALRSAGDSALCGWSLCRSQRLHAMRSQRMQT